MTTGWVTADNGLFNVIVCWPDPMSNAMVSRLDVAFACAIAHRNVSTVASVLSTVLLTVKSAGTVRSSSRVRRMGKRARRNMVKLRKVVVESVEADVTPRVGQRQ